MVLKTHMLGSLIKIDLFYFFFVVNKTIFFVEIHYI